MQNSFVDGALGVARLSPIISRVGAADPRRCFCRIIPVLCHPGSWITTSHSRPRFMPPYSSIQRPEKVQVLGEQPFRYPWTPREGRRRVAFAGRNRVGRGWESFGGGRGVICFNLQGINKERHDITIGEELICMKESDR